MTRLIVFCIISRTSLIVSVDLVQEYKIWSICALVCCCLTEHSEGTESGEVLNKREKKERVVDFF